MLESAAFFTALAQPEIQLTKTYEDMIQKNKAGISGFPGDSFGQREPFGEKKKQSDEYWTFLTVCHLVFS